MFTIEHVNQRQMIKFLFVILFVNIASSAQVNDTIYLDIDGKEITRTDFYKQNKLSKTKTWGFGSRGEKPTVQWFERQNFYEISPSEVKALQIEIGNLTERQIDSASILVIHFTKDYSMCYSFNNSSSSEWKQRQARNYKSLVQQNKDVEYFFITQEPNWKHIPKNIPVVIDSNRYITNKFFPTADFWCPSLLIVHPSGTYFLTRGEHRKDLITEVLAIFRKTYAENSK
jgi:hypothetical protein